MSEKGISETIEEAISKVGELGAQAGEAIKDFAESESTERFVTGIKNGAKTAASGIADGAKTAMSGIKEGGHIAKDTIKTGAEDRAKRKAEENKGNTIRKDMTFRLSNGVRIPAIGYGSYLSTENNGKQTILDAFEAGYRYIDTARFYKNEADIGEAIQESGIPRDDIFICSKVWPDMFGSDKLRESFEASCEDLKTNYLNLYLMHWPKRSQSDDEWVDKIQKTWAAMEDLYEEGRIKAIGVSNFLPHHFRPLLETAKIKPMLDQLELHVGYMQEYTLNYLKKEKIVPQAWSPLGRARFMDDDRITRLAEKYGKTNAQILLRFLLQRGIPVIPKSSSLERMKANQDIFDFNMTQDEISYLSCITQTGWSGEHPDIAEL